MAAIKKFKQIKVIMYNSKLENVFQKIALQNKFNFFFKSVIESQFIE